MQILAQALVLELALMLVLVQAPSREGLCICPICQQQQQE
jgi:hypothetical protein